MFGYYTVLLIITISLIFSIQLILYCDDALNKFNKSIFSIAYILILVIYIFEWVAAYLEKTNSSMQLIATFSMGVVLFLAPSITAIITWGIDDKKYTFLSFVVFSIITLSFIIGFSGMFTDLIFYYDAQNIYHRGEYYFIHLLLSIVSALLLLINTIRIGIKYQNKNNYILLLNFSLFLGTLLVQFLFTGVWIMWLSYIFAIGFTYVYYSSLVNQIDVLTGVLNRKCYDNQLYDIDTNAIILIFDVNKFKEINDTLGHDAGDYCLIEIANAIKKIYGKSGFCYRIGGDEFSVILHKNLELIEDLNSKFITLLSEYEYKMELPTVSIGYSYYYPNKSSIQEVIEEADRVMYQKKQQIHSLNISPK